jgi:hypothetical protein
MTTHSFYLMNFDRGSCSLLPVSHIKQGLFPWTLGNLLLKCRFSGIYEPHYGTLFTSNFGVESTSGYKTDVWNSFAHIYIYIYKQ